MGGTQMRNFRMFQNLCGEDALKNVVIVTNMWDGVEPGVGEAREAELARENNFFKPALEKGAQMARHENTLVSAQTIVRLLIDKHPLPLQIQKELADEHKDIVETSAGQELNRELNGQIRKHQEDMRVVAEEMEQARKEKDEETRGELEIETRRMREETERLERDAKRLASNYRREKGMFQAHLEKLERAKREMRRDAEYLQQPSRQGRLYGRSPPTASYRPAPTTSYRPPSTTLYQPPSTTLYQPPSTTLYQPPSTTLYQPPPTMSYRPTPTTGEQSVNAPGQFGTRPYCQDSEDRPGVLSSAMSLFRGKRDGR